MFLQSLSLKNFRNYRELNLQFHPQFNLILGNNAQGKSNLLEAIYYISFLGSFRSQVRGDMISYNQTEALIEASLKKSGLVHDIRIHLTEEKREVTLNGKKPSYFHDYYGLAPLLLFEPCDVYLLRDSPSIRRRFLKKALFLDNPLTLKPIKDYETVVSQKNKLLKERSFNQLDVWNEKLAQLGASIVYGRCQWIKNINRYLAQEYQKLTPLGSAQGKEKLTIQYHTSHDLNLEENNLEESIYQSLKQTIELNREEELRRRESLVGPHRDDWRALLDKRVVGTYGSQGENRSTIIALKSAETFLFQETKNDTPIFLLDDVASELDANRIRSLLNYLLETKSQVFLTTSQPSIITDSFKGSGRTFLVEEGKITVLE